METATKVSGREDYRIGYILKKDMPLCRITKVNNFGANLEYQIENISATGAKVIGNNFRECDVEGIIYLHVAEVPFTGKALVMPHGNIIRFLAKEYDKMRKSMDNELFYCKKNKIRAKENDKLIR
jgi:hypothetical protein